MVLPIRETGMTGEFVPCQNGIFIFDDIDQLAQVYSKAGGIGIASMIAQGEGREAPKPEGQWPYFSVGRISTFSG